MRRKETFATSGTRLKLRLFGGWKLRDALLKSPQWVKQAYSEGVAMGAGEESNSREKIATCRSSTTS